MRQPDTHLSPSIAALAVAALLLAACGGGTDSEVDGEPSTEDSATAATDDAEVDDGASDVGAPDTGGEGIDVVVTTSILGDIVSALVQDDGNVTVIMPPGSDPHGFEPSAQDSAALRGADLVIANGLQLEESLVSLLDSVEAEGGRVFTVADELDPIEAGSGGDDHGDEADHDDHADEGDDHADEGDDHADEGDDHADEGDDHADEGDDRADEGDDHADEHGHGPLDPHVWFDPVRMADGVELIAAEIAAVDDGLDDAQWTERGAAYRSELLDVHDEMAAAFADIPEDDRVLVTNHDALGYLAERYDFEILGTVVPGSSTQAETDARAFAELIEAVEAAGVTSIFAENTDSTVLAEQLANEVIGRGDLDIDVVRLYTDGLGEPGSGAETYLGLLRTDAGLIADALT